MTIEHALAQRMSRRRGLALALCAAGAAGAPRLLSAAATTDTGAGRARFGTVHSFGDAADGATPVDGVIQASDGNLYGCTMDGGAGYGVVYQVSPGAVRARIRIVHAFRNRADGARPRARLLQASDGYLYGTTYGPESGPTREGSVYRIDSRGSLETLHVFSGHDGAHPLGALIEASDGDFYGTTSGGGATGGGTVFRLARDGALTTLHDFVESSFVEPLGALVQASDGRLYGTTSQGGEIFDGTVYALTLDGQYELLHAFACNGDGDYPAAGLIQASDGDLYGTSFYGDPNPRICGDGTVFRTTLDGQVSVVCGMSRNDPVGAGSKAPLMQARDGYLYGTTVLGGPNGAGAVFRMADRRPHLVHAFLASEGDRSGLMQASNGLLYGTSPLGGRFARGSLYKIALPDAPA